MTTKTRRYAAETDVSVARSREEIEATLHRYGATGFGYVTDETIPAAVIVFRLDSRHYRLYVPLPRPDDPAYRRRVNQHAYADTPSAEAYQQGVRQRWRAVALYIKATLEAVASGIVSVEQALLAHALLPDGTTVGQWAEPQIAESYRRGRMPPQLPGFAPPALPAPDAHDHAA